MPQPIDPETLKTFRIAVALELKKLPQHKGKGAADRPSLEKGVDWFAEAVLERLALNGYRLVHEPPANAAIAYGLPRHDQLK